MKVEQGRVAAGIVRKEIKVQASRCRRGGENGLRSLPRFGRRLDKAEKIAAPILYGVVRQTKSIYRKRDEKAVPIAPAPVRSTKLD